MVTTPSFSAAELAPRAQWWAFGALFLGLAVKANDGRYSGPGMVFLTLAIGCALAGLFLPGKVPIDTAQARRNLNLVLVGCAVVFCAFWIMPDGFEPRWEAYLGALLVCALIALLLARLCVIPLFQRALFPLFLIIIAAFGTTTVLRANEYERTSPTVKFQAQSDVEAFDREAVKALASGKNPYSLRMPNVIGPDLPFYWKGATDKNGRLPFGYPYMPLSVAFTLPAYLLGDLRLAHVFALVGAAFFLAYARPSVTSKLAATVFLLFPSALLVLVMSWTEPVAIFFLSATVFCSFRAPRWLPLALGCLVASKQYTVFLLPLLPLLVPEKSSWRPLLWRSLGVAAILTLPMALWDVDGFYRSAVQMQFKQPFRADSLSYLVIVLKAGGPRLSPLFGFAALLAGLWWGARKAPRNATHWCAAGAAAYLGFFALNKQAFANYYFWIFALLITAVAVALPETQESPVQGEA